jgi:hypothetical protein
MAEVDRLPASVGQRLLWVLEQFRGEHGSTNCPVVLRLRGPLDVDRLTDALTALTARHESLRTTLTGRGPHLSQVIHEPRPVRLRCEDLGSDDPDRSLRHAVSAEIGRPLDAGEWPTRTVLFRLGENEHALCLNLHHAATDGGSCGLILRDLEALAGSGPLPAVQWQYATFCRWQAEWLAGPGPDEDREYWSTHLQDARLPRIPLRPTPPGAPWVSASFTGAVDAATVTLIGRFARSQHTTLASALFAIYHLVLRELTGDDDLAVATFFANRTCPEVRDTVGLLANMAVMRTRTGGADDVKDVLRRTHVTAMDGFVHQRLPYQLLRGDTLSAPDRRADDAMFQLVPPLPSSLRVAGADAEIIVSDQLGSRFECEFQLYPQHGGLCAVLCYNRARLDDDVARRLVKGYERIAREVARRAAREVGSPTVAASPHRR